MHNGGLTKDSSHLVVACTQKNTVTFAQSIRGRIARWKQAAWPSSETRRHLSNMGYLSVEFKLIE